MAINYCPHLAVTKQASAVNFKPYSNCAVSGRKEDTPV